MVDIDLRVYVRGKKFRACSCRVTGFPAYRDNTKLQMLAKKSTVTTTTTTTIIITTTNHQPPPVSRL
ncbi:hypothetical protein M0802_003291 [Mischocyttarus mexicanus]|nr:hypothetical protein M0802_003291 [Mischocyttarus mexicanus]